MQYTWKIGGEAGFGIMTTGLMFSKILSRLGYEIFDYIEYPSLIRGGHNAYEVCFSADKVNTLKEKIDFLVCLNKETFEKHHHRLTNKSYLLYDQEEFSIEGDYLKIPIPFKKIIQELKGEAVMRNIIALGASIALLNFEIDHLLVLIAEQFGKKKKEIVEFNYQFAKRGYYYIKDNYSSKTFFLEKPKEKKEKLVLTGNDAFSLASVIADCRLYVAYPMTPSSSVLTNLASWQEKTGMIVRHAEDEISVINTAIGASFAGVRSAVGTSGGGFALMVESVSFAGIAEIPLVIFLSQRPGPATGMPTWTEQGDLLFSIFSGHGEFPKIVLSAGDVEEMIELTIEAFNLADIYQLPVIILSDMHLSESHQTIEKEKVLDLIKNYKVKRGKIIDHLPSQKTTKSLNFLRYKVTDNGISEVILPGNLGYFYQANSYEHLEDGHTTEESLPRKKQVDKRQKKWQTYLESDFKLPKFYGEKEASIIFVSWGSNKGVILEAQKRLKEKGIQTGFYHFTHLYPLAKEKIRNLFDDKKRYLLIENNSLGQFGKIIQMETGFEIKEKVLRYDGRPIEVEQILEKINI